MTIRWNGSEKPLLYSRRRGNDKIGIVGASTTGMLALVAASYFPKVTLIIALTPSDFIMEGFYRGNQDGATEWPSDGSSVSWKGEPLVFGITTLAITTVPSWFYILSMVFGVLSGFGCKEYAPVMVEILKRTGVNQSSKMYNVFRFGFASAPLMFISFHTVCCAALLLLQAALRAGVTAAAAEEYSLLPLAACLIPFTVWRFVVDIPITVSYIYFVI